MIRPVDKSLRCKAKIIEAEEAAEIKEVEEEDMEKVAGGTKAIIMTPTTGTTIMVAEEIAVVEEAVEVAEMIQMTSL